ncbi:MAG: hypothetical protein IJ834_05850 [Paludibacteraceae bacterium]|nr:hypothetical protein [Paludibacteraceae bacterium]
MENPNTTNSSQSIDIIRFIKQCFKYWYWFVISVGICGAIGLVYLIVTPKQYSVYSTLLLRQDDAKSGLMNAIGGDAGGLLSMMGMNTGSKSIDDEMEILSSRTFMNNAITDLGLQNEYRKVKRMRWLGQYPEHDLSITYPEMFIDTIQFNARVEVKKKKDYYLVDVKYLKDHSKHKVASLNEPIETAIGQIKITENTPLEVGDKIRILTMSRDMAVEHFRKTMSIKRTQKNASSITISCETDMPQRAIDLIGRITYLYNQDAVYDKNKKALTQLQFSEERLQMVAHELDSIEHRVEDFKLDNKMSGMSAEAEIYLEAAATYQKQLVEIETQLNLVDYIKRFVSDKQNENSTIPANLGVSDPSLVSVISQYNELLLRRMQMQRTATDKNPIVEQLDEQISAMRSNIVMSINSVRDGLEIMKKDAIAQESKFSGKLENMPVQERQYIQIKRMQTLKQQVFLLLYQKREESALTLASVMTPVKVLDEPRKLPLPLGPRKMVVALISLIIGVAIPFGIILILEMYQPQLATLIKKEELAEKQE